MKTISLYTTTILSVLLLSACGRAVQTTNIREALQNPLFAEMYAEELIGRLTNLEIAADPQFSDKKVLTYAENTKAEWQKIAKEASQKKWDGQSGQFTALNSTEFIGGHALLYKQILYTSPTFFVVPAPTIHVYASSNVDPRDSTFPAADDVLIDVLPTPYGAQSINAAAAPKQTRTIVLFDPDLKRILGFAQLDE